MKTQNVIHRSHTGVDNTVSLVKKETTGNFNFASIDTKGVEKCGHMIKEFQMSRMF